MNVFLWILQALLASHTLAGALWKLSNSEQTVPSLRALPHGAWLGLSVVEVLCSVGLVLPAFFGPAAPLAPVAAAVVASEMLLFTGLHLRSGETDHGPARYWLVVSALSAFLAVGRSLTMAS